METEGKQAKASRDVEDGAHCPPRAVISLGPHEYKTTEQRRKKREKNEHIRTENSERRNEERITSFILGFVFVACTARDGIK